MKNKKIIFIADARSIHTAKWVNYFIEEGYETYIATYASENITKCNNVFFLSKTKQNHSGINYHYLLSVRHLSKIIREIKPNYINAHFSYSMGLIAFLAKTIAKSKAKFSIVCHGSDILVPPLPIITNKINKFLVKNADKIFAVSDQIKDKLIYFNACPEKIFTGQYGIDNNEQKLNNIKDIDLISNRNYVPNSNIDFMLEGLARIKNLGLNIVFILPYINKEKLNQYQSNYSFITFYSEIPYSQMQNLVSRSKVYISATKSDGTSLSLLEAMSSGSIPVVSNIISNRSWILDGVNGFLFDTEDEFIIKVKEALNNVPNNTATINKQLIHYKGNYSTQMRKIEEFLIC